MKKIWGIVAGVVVLAIVGVVVSMAIIKGNQSEQVETSELVNSSSVEYFELSQNKDQLAVMRAWAVGSEQFTKIEYQIDTQDKVHVATAKYDKATESWDKYDDDFEGLNYIDTGVITFDLSNLTAGEHIIQVFVCAGSNVSECIYQKIFTIQ